MEAKVVLGELFVGLLEYPQKDGYSQKNIII